MCLLWATFGPTVSRGSTRSECIGASTSVDRGRAYGAKPGLLVAHLHSMVPSVGTSADARCVARRSAKERRRRDEPGMRSEGSPGGHTPGWETSSPPRSRRPPLGLPTERPRPRAAMKSPVEALVLSSRHAPSRATARSAGPTPARRMCGRTAPSVRTLGLLTSLRLEERCPRVVDGSPRRMVSEVSVARRLVGQVVPRHRPRRALPELVVNAGLVSREADRERPRAGPSKSCSRPAT